MDDLGATEPTIVKNCNLQRTKNCAGVDRFRNEFNVEFNQKKKFGVYFFNLLASATHKVGFC